MSHEIKATLADVLSFIKIKEVVEPMELLSEFGYTYWGARTRLKRLEKATLVEKLGIRAGAYYLTNERFRRLEYYERVLHNFHHKQ